MSYVTAYVAAVPTKDKDTYVAHIRQTTQIFKEHGAVRCLECWGSDVPSGKLTSFPLAVKCEPDETVVLGFVEWSSRASHDEGMPKVMVAMQNGIKTGALSKPPLDGTRLIFGGFDVLLEN
ncbi:MAG: DUF1428 domain-containing protein [Hyphomicrobiaceae bacterium]